MLGRVEQYSFTRPSSIKLQCRLGKFRNNVEKGEWVLFSNTSLSHKLRILLQKPHYPIQVKVDQIEHWRLIHMGRFLTEYEENWKRLSLYFLGEKKYPRLYPGRSTYYGVHMKINYECSLVHPCFWIHKLSIQSYFDMTCKWSCPRQCICKLSIKSYLWHAW